MSDQKEIEIAIILLAAGSSSRMGKSKQMITIDGETLLEKSVKVALQSKSKNIMVVLGANATDHRARIENFPVEVVLNATWNLGMGNSLKVGIAHLKSKAMKKRAVIIMVCDQPLLNSAHLDKLIDTYSSTRKSIVASSYSGSAGVPALFDDSMFEQLENLSDHQGAKKVIESNRDQLIVIDFPEGSIDLDTPEDVIRFQK